MRYQLHETLRQYAQERLAQSGELSATQRRHLAFYLALAERAEPELTGAEEGVWLGRLEQEHDNLRAALQWTLDCPDAELGLRLAGAVWRLWWMHGHLSEGRRWLEGLLAVVETGGAALAATRAKALNGAGLLAVDQGDLRRAAALVEESVGLFRDLGDKQGTANALLTLGRPAMLQGDYGRATALWEESLAVSRDLEDKQGIAWSLSYLGLIATAQGNYSRATALLEESLALSRDLGVKRGMAEGMEGLAVVACAQEQPERAARLFGAAQAFREAIGQPLWLADRASYDRSVAAAREGLGKEAFAAARAEGRAMTPEQAVAYALQVVANKVSNRMGARPRRGHTGSDKRRQAAAAGEWADRAGGRSVL